MTHIAVRNSLVTVRLDDADVALLQGRTVSLERGAYRYPVVRHRGGTRKTIRLHALLLGPQARGRCIDHIDGDVLNNQRSNLRVVNWQANQINRRQLNSNNTSGIRGVIWDKSRVQRGQGLYPWSARIAVNGRSVNLGYFATIEAATLARQAGELKYFGELCPQPRDWGGLAC